MIGRPCWRSDWCWSR